MDITALDKHLVVLQTECKTELMAFHRSRLGLYTKLAESYLWWTTAKTIPGYLEKKYNRQRKIKSVKYGINFSLLLRLMLGDDLDNRTADRYSRTLNTIHLEYTNKKSYYQTDTINKLVQFIVDSDGVSNMSYKTTTTTESQDLQKDVPIVGKSEQKLEWWETYYAERTKEANGEPRKILNVLTNELLPGVTIITPTMGWVLSQYSAIPFETRFYIEGDHLKTVETLMAVLLDNLRHDTVRNGYNIDPIKAVALLGHLDKAATLSQ